MCDSNRNRRKRQSFKDTLIDSVSICEYWSKAAEPLGIFCPPNLQIALNEYLSHLRHCIFSSPQGSLCYYISGNYGFSPLFTWIYFPYFNISESRNSYSKTVGRIFPSYPWLHNRNASYDCYLLNFMIYNTPHLQKVHKEGLFYKST